MTYPKTYYLCGREELESITFESEQDEARLMSSGFFNDYKPAPVAAVEHPKPPADPDLIEAAPEDDPDQGPDQLDSADDGQPAPKRRGCPPKAQ